MFFKKAQIVSVVGAAMLVATAAPVVLADGHRSDRTIIYMTRHAEKQDVLVPISDVDTSDNRKNICNDDGDRCAEELSALGELRAELLAEWLEDRGILDRITDVISSDKQRTRQTVEPTARKLLAMGVHLENVEMPADQIFDGVRQVPADKATLEGNEVKGNSGSVDPTLAAIADLEHGSVALIAAHSGTIYRIMGGQDTDGNPATPVDGSDTSVGLGIDTTVGDNQAEITLFPKKLSDGKVPTFGDLWKIVINHNTGEARVAWRKNLQPPRLSVANQTTNRGGTQENSYW